VNPATRPERVVSLAQANQSSVIFGAILLVAIILCLLNPSLAFALSILAGLLAISYSGLSHAWLVVILVAPWGTLANAATQGRLVPLGLDLFLILFAVALLGQPPERLKVDRIATVALLGGLLVQAIGLAEMLNPTGLPVVDAMEGFRAFFLPVSGLAIGVFLRRRGRAFGTDLSAAIVVSALTVAAMGIRQALIPGSMDLAIIQNSQSGLLPFLITGTNRLRAFSPLPGPFHFGLLMLIGIAALAAPTLRRWTRWRFIAVAFLVIALLFNATRLNWLGTAVAVGTILLSSLSFSSIRAWVIRLVAVVLALVATTWASFQLEALAPVRQFAMSLIDPTTTTSFIYRVLGWRHDIFPAIASAPWVGYGTGMAKDGLGPFTSHNVFLKLLLEGGGLLFGAYFVTMAAVVAALVRKRREPLAQFGLGLTAGVHAAGMFGPILDAYPANLFFWLVLGAGLAEPAEATEPSVTR
jgi:O-antigen ligase/polysaccharide polymerase Wzy-like membrane protein